MGTGWWEERGTVEGTGEAGGVVTQVSRQCTPPRIRGNPPNSNFGCLFWVFLASFFFGGFFFFLRIFFFFHTESSPFWAIILSNC